MTAAAAAAIHSNESAASASSAKTSTDDTRADVDGTATSPKVSLAARLALSAGMNKGFKSIADIAKPALDKRLAGFTKRVMERSPLDGAMFASAKARDEGRRVLNEGEQLLARLYARDHDGMVTARALMVGSNKAIKAMMGAAETLENEAAKARTSLQIDQQALLKAKNSSVSGLVAERDTLKSILLGELRDVETDTTFSITALLDKVQRIERAMARQGDLLGTNVRELGEELELLKRTHADYVEKAESKERRLANEIARLCETIDRLNLERQQENDEHARTHAEAVERYENELATRNRMIAERDEEIRILKGSLEGTAKSMAQKMSDLQREKELREQRLKEENEQAVERGRRASIEFQQRLTQLQVEKEEEEKKLSETLESTRQDGERQAESLRLKLEKMRKLQELALGVGGGDGGGDNEGRPSPRGRQLLYWESLKSKSRETSSMTWRGQDVFAHEVQPGPASEMSRQDREAKPRRASVKPSKSSRK